MNKLKITAETVDGNLYKSQYNSFSAIDPKERDNCSWWYLHGKLQKKIGYDKGIVTNAFTAGYSEETIDEGYWYDCESNHIIPDKNKLIINKLKLNGIVPVEVEGISKLCTGFFWISKERTISIPEPHKIWTLRGLVIFQDDIDEFNYCYNCWAKKTCVL